MSHSLCRTTLALVTLALTATLTPAQYKVKEPPRADKLDVQIRYRIRADRDERIRQYRVLEKHLADLGFVDAKKDDPDRDLDILDPTHERFNGTIPGDKVFDILSDPRVQNIVFAPSGFTYPDSPDKPVAIRIGLRTGLLTNVQQQLHKQTVTHLGKLGFEEALGYDTKGYTLVRGSIPLKSLDTLVKDVRSEPSGWFLPATRLEDLPTPFRDRNPMRWTEVLNITEFPPPFSPPPVLGGQLKYSADLRAALLDPAGKDTPIRVEAVFNDRIAGFDTLRGVVEGKYVGASLDGVVGNVANIRFSKPSLVEAFATERNVLHVRLARQGWETLDAVQAGKGTAIADALKAARLDELHKLGYKGTGTKVILIASDFTGVEKYIGTELPKQTKIVDLTVELTSELTPAKSELSRIGAGTAAARVLAAAAPDCDLVLVRIDPGCFFFLRTAIALARGELRYTDALQVRLAELAAKSQNLDRDRKIAIDAYRAAFADLSDNEVAVALRKKAKADLEAVYAREKVLAEYVRKFNDYQKDVTTALAGAQVIVNTLAWESGYPLDSLSDFDATIDRLSTPLPPRIQKRPADPDATPKPPLIWVQAAGVAGQAVWGGPFHDANRDGLMEFAAPGTKLPNDNWSPQLNFLGTRTFAGDVSPEVAKDAKLRFLVQWREPADPNFPDTDIPAYPLVLRVLRQIDPNGEKRPNDEMLEVARSVAVPNIIFRTKTYLVFEQMVEYTVPVAGRFALVMESAAQPEPLIPALKRQLEIYPRVVIETLGTATTDPRVVFRSYTTTDAGVGIPGDALGAITVGTISKTAQVGGGTGLTLRTKPDLIGPDAFVFGNDTFGGPGASTGFAGGAAVLLVQSRAAAPNVFGAAGIEAGKKLELPQLWLKTVPKWMPPPKPFP